MVLFMLIPRVHRFQAQPLALVPHAPNLIRQVRSRHQPYRCLTFLSSLQQKHSQADPNASAQSHQKPEPLERINSETLQKIDTGRLDEGPKRYSLLAEQNASDKEQRKADWAIMKEMSKYLWPKVGRHATRPFSQCLITYIG